MEGLESTVEQIRENFAEKYAARERAIQLSREVIRYSANAIRAMHRFELDQAERLLGQARDALGQIVAALAEHSDVYHAGFVQDAQKEYAEACLTLAVVDRRPVPSPEALGVGGAAYLHGLGETIGEVRRHCLDRIREGAIAESERLLAAMDDMFDLLVTIDFPDGMTGGLRRTTDVARGILEKTRGDLTTAVRQRDLESTLRRFEENLRR